MPGRGSPGAAGTNYQATFKDVAPGVVDAQVQITSSIDAPMAGVYFSITVRGTDYAGGTAQLIDLAAPAGSVSLAATRPATANTYLRASARGVRVASAHRQIEITLTAAQEFVVQDNRSRGNGDIEVSFPLSLGNLTAGQTARSEFTIKATGNVDKSAAKLAIDPSHPGRKFDGMGGNFRIQSPADAAEIQFNLDNLRVAWGRISMPLNQWQPEENTDPVQSASAGRLNNNVRQAMEMGQTLAKKKIPFVISAWQAPRWALVMDNAAPGGRGGGGAGKARINAGKWDGLSKAIGSYIEYMKRNFGAEPALFSFNESDGGYDVLQSPQEHAQTIKRMGAYFASRGLATRMLLGDTANPTGTNFINAALQDAEAVKYIGAVSFHSWNGGTVEQYTRWSQVAKQLNVPLLVAEGGTDPQAYRARAIFLEPWYALDEIRQYIEICRIAEPVSILHWQYTNDFSILTGGRGGQPLRPAQRFWQIKQLGMTAPDSMSVPMTCDKPAVVSCAFVDHGTYVVHVVNSGAARPATLSGIPDNIKELRVYVTDSQRGMKEAASVAVDNGTAQLMLDCTSYTSVVGKP
jgi:hypothetical protein